MATLNLKNSFEMSVRGKLIEGWQGVSADNDADDVFAITVDGNYHHPTGTLADAAARNLWVASEDAPAAWDFCFFVCDVDVDLQIVATTWHMVIPVKAGVPFTIGHDELLVAVSTTEIVADATPSYEAIAKIRINNRSGSTGNYVFLVVD